MNYNGGWTMILPKKELRVKIILTEEMLGMMPADPEILTKFVIGKSPNKETMEDELLQTSVEEMVAEQTTIFPKNEDGIPFMWDYQMRGMFKDACGLLRRSPGTECSKIKSYKKIIDGMVFVSPRQIPIHIPEGETFGNIQRSLRAATPQGERISLASSETVPVGSSLEFTVKLFDESLEGFILECLDYGVYRGLGQWRNSGKGLFTYQILE